jgi:hypothetical protein
MGSEQARSNISRCVLTSQCDPL